MEIQPRKRPFVHLLCNDSFQKALDSTTYITSAPSEWEMAEGIKNYIVVL